VHLTNRQSPGRENAPAVRITGEKQCQRRYEHWNQFYGTDLQKDYQACVADGGVITPAAKGQVAFCTLKFCGGYPQFEDCRTVGGYTYSWDCFCSGNFSGGDVCLLFYPENACSVTCECRAYPAALLGIRPKHVYTPYHIRRECFGVVVPSTIHTFLVVLAYRTPCRGAVWAPSTLRHDSMRMSRRSECLVMGCPHPPRFAWRPLPFGAR